MKQEKIEDNLDMDRHFWQYYRQRLGCLDLALLEYLPDFLIISPPKTGTTWLSQNLNCHQEIFIPAIKETKYFSTYWRLLDINWYLRQFQSASDLKKGEATTSYSILPSQTIQFIRMLIPDIKLIFLMRDPVERAWSHAKHDYKYRYSTFRHYEGEFNDIPDQRFIEHFIDERSLFYGDYLGCLRRWLCFFPKEQLYLGFFEAINHNSKQLLTDIFNHLDVTIEVNWSEFQLSEKILPGIERSIPPHLRSYLMSIFRERTLKLDIFLKENFSVETPPVWTNNTLEVNRKLHYISGQGKIKDKLVNLPWLNDEQQSIDQTLVTILDEELFSPTPYLIEENYLQFNILFYGESFYALAQALGPIDLIHLNEDILNEYQISNQCIIAGSLDEIKQQIVKLHRNLPELVLENYQGFNIVHYRNRFYALSQKLGTVDLTKIEENTLRNYRKNNQCVITCSFDEAKFKVRLLTE